MLRFRDEHMLAFEESARPTLVERIAEIFRDMGRGCIFDLSDEELRSLVRVALEFAAEFGLRRENSLIQFANIFIHYDADFHTQPGIAELLKDAKLIEQDRITALYRRLGFDEDA